MWSKLPAATNQDSVSTRDSLMYGQHVWRMVYYPSGDSIYINPFKAAYEPTYDPALWHNGVDSVRATGWYTQQRYTYAAIPDTSIMTVQYNPATNDFWQDQSWPSNITDTLKILAGTDFDTSFVKTARLRDGFYIAGSAATDNNRMDAPLPYKYRHRLYVSIQNLAGGRVATLHSNHSGNLPTGDYKISTHINFAGVYNPCAAVGSDRVSIP